MSDPGQGRWQSRYADIPTSAPAACDVLASHRYLLPTHGRALDLACGLGGNARLLANHGLDTWAWDFAPNAIATLTATAPANLHAEVRNVVATPPPAASFDVIAVSRFLDRPLCAAIAAALRPGGLLFYQTFVQDAVDSTGPRNPAYRLAVGELLDLFSALRPLFYTDLGTVGDHTRGIRNEAQLIAIRAAGAAP